MLPHPGRRGAIRLVELRTHRMYPARQEPAGFRQAHHGGRLELLGDVLDDHGHEIVDVDGGQNKGTGLEKP